MFKYVGALIGLSLMISQSALAYNYVSIAAVRLTNPDGSPRGHFGKGWSDQSVSAEQTALANCGYEGCIVLGTTSGCISLEYDSSKRVMAQIGDNVVDAQNNVNYYCQTSTTVGGCVPWATLCADGYDSENQ